MYQKILIPLDGSELAECSLEHAKAIAKGCNVADVDYKGEVCVILYNNSDIDFIIEKGDRIAQFTLHKKENVKINKGDKLQESTRGDKVLAVVVNKCR